MRIQWLALAGALVVLAGTVVAWALSRAAERIEVVSIAGPVRAGEVIEVDDLRISEIAIDADVRGLVPAASLPNLAGRVAAIDLAPGVLVSTGMWTTAAELGAHERTVGAVLGAGRYPGDLTQGSWALAIDVRPPTGDAAATAPPTTTVRVLDAAVDETGAMVVTLAVPADVAVAIASLAATDTLALAGIPDAASPGAPADALPADPSTVEAGTP